MRQNAPIGSIYLDVVWDKATREIGWKPSELRAFLSHVTSIEQVEEMIPGAKLAIEECLDAIAAILRRRNLLTGEFNRHAVIDPMLYSNKKQLLRELRSAGGLGEFRLMMNRIPDRALFSKQVLKYGSICSKVDISAAFFAIQVAIMDANAGTY